MISFSSLSSLCALFTCTVCVYVHAAVLAASLCLTCTSLCSQLCISRLGALYSCSNCHRSHCSSLDAMDAIIGHPKHSDQCRCYCWDFRHRGPQTGRPSRGQRGSGREGERWGCTACYVCTDTGRLPVEVSIDSLLSNMYLLSPSSSLMLSLHRVFLSGLTQPH